MTANKCVRALWIRLTWVDALRVEVRERASTGTLALLKVEGLSLSDWP